MNDRQQKQKEYMTRHFEVESASPNSCHPKVSQCECGQANKVFPVEVCAITRLL